MMEGQRPFVKKFKGQIVKNGKILTLSGSGSL